MENYKYFKNEKCEYYPCHKISGEYFNCMFCFCPLYSLGTECGGDFAVLSNGVKDCSDCTVVHSFKGYDHVIAKLKSLRR